MMTNDELKKKICKIIADNYLPKEMPDRLEDYKLYRFAKAADALIAAGLKFDTVVSHTATFDLSQMDRINKLESQAAKAEHRAEVAERALKHAVNVYIAHTETSSKKKWWYKYFLREAEKVLAEEQGDGKKKI